MSMIQAPWDVEERVEDALVAHIKTICTEVAMTIPANSVVEPAYPLVIVYADGSDNANDTGRITGRKRVNVVISIITDALNYLGAEGSIDVLRTAREHHRAIKQSVIGAVSGNELHTELNAENPEGVAFSMAYMGAVTRDAGDGKLMTMQELDIIAQPKEM